MGFFGYTIYGKIKIFQLNENEEYKCKLSSFFLLDWQASTETTNKSLSKMKCGYKMVRNGVKWDSLDYYKSGSYCITITEKEIGMSQTYTEKAKRHKKRKKEKPLIGIHRELKGMPEEEAWQ